MTLRRKRGSSIKLDGRAGLLYRDGDHSLSIDSEMLSGGEYDLVAYRDSIESWDPPFDREELLDGDREQIIENVTQELKKYRIDWQ